MKVLFRFSLLFIFISFLNLYAQNDFHQIVITENTTSDTLVKNLSGVISGPLPPYHSPSIDLTEHLQDIGVKAIRNNGYYDDRLDVEGIFNCGGDSVYPSWDGDPYDENNYHWGPSDTLFESIVNGGFKILFRVGGEAENGPRHHDFKGPQNKAQEDNWIVAATKIVERYNNWKGQKDFLDYLNLWTEWPNKDFYDGTKGDFIKFWQRAFDTLKTHFPKLKIGGPGFLVPTVQVIRGNTNNPAVDFLKYMYAHNTKPDWIGWHLWNNNPEKYYIAAKQYRDLLDGVNDFASMPWSGTGFFKDTEIFCDAYGTSMFYDTEGDTVKEMTDEEIFNYYNRKEGSSTFIGQLISMEYGGIKEAYYYRAGDPESDPGQGPGMLGAGHSGLFYGDTLGTYKPKAYALRLYTKMAREFPKLMMTDYPSIGDNGSKLWVMASRNENEKAVLISNTEKSPIDYSITWEGEKITRDKYRVLIFQVDDDNDGSVPTVWKGGNFTIDEGRVQLLIIKKKPNAAEELSFKPESFSLEQNYPNPFNPLTIIKYTIPKNVHVKLTVFNLLGEKVAILVNENQSAGDYSVRFDGRNLPSGIYFYTLHAGNFITTKKMSLLK